MVWFIGALLHKKIFQKNHHYLAWTLGITLKFSAVVGGLASIICVYLIHQTHSFGAFAMFIGSWSIPPLVMFLTTLTMGSSLCCWAYFKPEIFLKRDISILPTDRAVRISSGVLLLLLSGILYYVLPSFHLSPYESLSEQSNTHSLILQAWRPGKDELYVNRKRVDIITIKREPDSGVNMRFHIDLDWRGRAMLEVLRPPYSGYETLYLPFKKSTYEIKEGELVKLK
ncbi:MAG: hypothetical protein OEY52_09125 [Gammaproteobacteria bacterium]|nr:hypothetical protein [Gammaproteobacteria bacterium]